jgi:hypothetical protein
MTSRISPLRGGEPTLGESMKMGSPGWAGMVGLEARLAGIAARPGGVAARPAGVIPGLGTTADEPRAVAFFAGTVHPFARHEDITRFIEVNLRSAGYEVSIPLDGEEALHKDGVLCPDLGATSLRRY